MNMGLATNLIVIYFCILFAMYMADESMKPVFMDFLSGDYAISWNTIIVLSISALAGIVTAVLFSDVMTGAIVTIVNIMTSWLIIPSNMVFNLPEPIYMFITGIFTIIWGIALIGFFRGYEP